MPKKSKSNSRLRVLKARWLLFSLPSIVLFICGGYIISVAPQIRGVAYIIFFVASWISIIGDIIRRADKGKDPHSGGIKKVSDKQMKKAQF